MIVGPQIGILRKVMKTKKIKNKKFTGSIIEVVNEHGYSVNVFVEWVYRAICATDGYTDCAHIRAVLKNHFPTKK
jgi:hypothetical protein